MFSYLQRTLRDESGFTTLWLVVLFVGLLGLVGLVTDGAGYNSAKAEAYAVAQSAARAGANSLQASAAIEYGDAAVGGGAVAAAQSYLSAAGLPGSVSYSGNTVNVQIDTDYPTVLLSIVGVTSLSLSVTAQAVLLSE